MLEDLVNKVGKKCKNKERGCSYKGEFEDVKRHEEGCRFQTPNVNQNAPKSIFLSQQARLDELRTWLAD